MATEDKKNVISESFENISKELVDNAKEYLTEEAKNIFMQWLQETGLPKLKELADGYTDQLKKDAANETGWNKFRDSTFIPVLISATYWLAQKMIPKMINKEDK